METAEPFVNMLALLTMLSITAERLTNVFKMRRTDLRTRRKPGSDEERSRERAVQTRSVGMGILVAIVVKADIFSILAHLEDPWAVLGWVRVSEYQWMRSPALSDPGAFIYALVGCVITGVALGFGSGFWHDILGTVNEFKSMARKRGSVELANRGSGAGWEEPSTAGGGDDA